MALVEGFGDEVVLFVAFLALSLIFLTLVSCWQKQRSPPQPSPPAPSSRQPESPAHQVQDVEEEPVPIQPAVPPISGADGLRHRSHVSTPDDGAASNIGTVKLGASGGGRGSSGVDGGRGESGEGGGGRGKSGEGGGGRGESDDGGRGESDDGGRGESDDGGRGEAGGQSRDGNGRGTSEEDDQREEINVRLIQAGGPGTARQVCVSPNASIQYLRRTYFDAELSEHRPVKFIYQGRILSNDATTLNDLNIGDGEAMHVHVGRPHPPGTPLQPPEPEALDLSRFFVPLFGVILGIVWVMMLLYPYVFSLLSKLFLFLLSLGYVILTYMSTYGT